MGLTELEQEVKSFVGRHDRKQSEISSRLLALEQHATAPVGGPFNGYEGKSLGEHITESEQFKGMIQHGGRTSGQIRVGSFHKTAITNATGGSQPLVAPYRVPGIVTVGQQRLTIRDLMPAYPAPSNLIEFARELVVTSAAASQTGGSPNSGENVAKAESGITYELASAKVETLAHWIPASKQLMDDSSAFSNYISGRMNFLLKVQEESQLLNGDGTNNKLVGLTTTADVFDTSYSSTSDTFLDVLRKAIGQVYRVSKLPASGIVLHPDDWQTIQLTKQTGTGISSGQYIFSDPQSAGTPQLWGLPVVESFAMSPSQFLVGAFDMAAAIWDRADATVEVSREHSDFFVKNMVAILCEERLTLTTYRPSAFCYGGFPFGS